MHGRENARKIAARQKLEKVESCKLLKAKMPPPEPGKHGRGKAEMAAKSNRRRVGSLNPESAGSVGKVGPGKSREKVGPDKSRVAAIGRTTAVPADADSSGEPWRAFVQRRS